MTRWWLLGLALVAISENDAGSFGQSLKVTGDSKDEVADRLRPLQEWSKARGWSKGDLPSITYDSGEKRFEANGRPLVPFEGSSPIGVNCHGSSLFSAGLLPSFREVSERELAFWLESPLCKEVPPKEKLLPGDIGRVRSARRFDELHTFVYLSDSVVYEKVGTEYPIRFSTRAEASAPYEVADGCDHVAGVAKGCKRFVNYHRCRPLDEYVKEKGTTAFRKAHDALAEIEKKVAAATALGDPFPDGTKKRLEQLSKVADEALADLQKEPADDPQRFLWDGFKRRAHALGKFSGVYFSDRYEEKTHGEKR